LHRHLPTRCCGPSRHDHSIGDLEFLRFFPELGAFSADALFHSLQSLAGLRHLPTTLRSLGIGATKRKLDLDVKLGGTRNLELLPKVGRLEHVELWMIKGLDTLEAVGSVPRLRYLFLQALRQVTSLPDFAGTPVLERLHIETMKGLRDVGPINSASGLKELLVVDMPHLVLGDLACLVGHRSLEAITIGLGSRKKNEAAEALFGLPPVMEFKAWWRDV
jgi:hypothetical protein